jgi:hypothetical protein
MEDTMPRIIVERTFDPPISPEDLIAAMQRIGGCVDLYGARYIRSRVSTDRRRSFCEFDAADAQSVRDLQIAAQAPFDRVWPAEVIGES